jgi:hypothetical protein
MLGDLRADVGERPRKIQHVLVFGALPELAEVLVIAILFAPFSVTARCLDVTVRARADPDVAIGRWNRELTNTLARGFVAH